MREIFMSLLLDLDVPKKLIEAIMYEDGKYSTITIETDSGRYTISVVKKEGK